MSENTTSSGGTSRRDFLKLAAMGAAASSASLIMAAGARAEGSKTPAAAARGAAKGAGVSAPPAMAPGGAPPPLDELKPMAIPDALLAMTGISKRTMEEHVKLYQGYVQKTNEILKKLRTVDLSSANQVFSDLRALKVELTFAIGGVKNHELYFKHLGGKGGQPTGQLASMIARDFGSYDAWAAEFKACALSARGWVWLAFDRDFGRLYNHIGDSQNTYAVWNATPIVALDTYEHAYFMDFGVKRADYVDAFMQNLDWGVVAENFQRATGWV